VFSFKGIGRFHYKSAGIMDYRIQSISCQVLLPIIQKTPVQPIIIGLFILYWSNSRVVERIDLSARAAQQDRRVGCDEELRMSLATKLSEHAHERNLISRGKRGLRLIEEINAFDRITRSEECHKRLPMRLRQQRCPAEVFDESRIIDCPVVDTL
jgi:hypothetical protein